MGAIYQGELYCSQCGDELQELVARDLWESPVSDYPSLIPHCDFKDFQEFEEHLRSLDERRYESDDYPKYCDTSKECDLPQHCADCHCFLENDLTKDGVYYVGETIRNGWPLALEVWKPFYEERGYEFT